MKDSDKALGPDHSVLRFDINAVDQSGETALHKAAKAGRMPAVEALVEAGADVSIRDKEGRLAHDAASDAGQLDCAEYLFRPRPLPDQRLEVMT